MIYNLKNMHNSAIFFMGFLLVLALATPEGKIFS
jgi:hypothetical protein